MIGTRKLAYASSLILQQKGGDNENNFRKNKKILNQTYAER